MLGRLSKIFTPRTCIAVASLVFAVGTTITALAPTFAGFLAGRAITGLGGAGIVACSIIIVLDLAPEKRRGLFLGLINTGFTVGVSLGAVVAGAMVASTGWVCYLCSLRVTLTVAQRVFFLAQAPFSAVAGFSILFAIPKKTSSQVEPVWYQLRRIDYLGVVTLV